MTAALHVYESCRYRRQGRRCLPEAAKELLDPTARTARRLSGRPLSTLRKRTGCSRLCLSLSRFSLATTKTGVHEDKNLARIRFSGSTNGHLTQSV